MSDALSLSPLLMESLDVPSSGVNNILRLVLWVVILIACGKAIHNQYKMFAKHEAKLSNLARYDLLQSKEKRELISKGGLNRTSALFMAFITLALSVNVFLSK